MADSHWRTRIPNTAIGDRDPSLNLCNVKFWHSTIVAIGKPLWIWVRVRQCETTITATLLNSQLPHEGRAIWGYFRTCVHSLGGDYGEASPSEMLCVMAPGLLMHFLSFRNRFLQNFTFHIKIDGHFSFATKNVWTLTDREREVMLYCILPLLDNSRTTLQTCLGTKHSARFKLIYLHWFNMLHIIIQYNKRRNLLQRCKGLVIHNEI